MQPASNQQYREFLIFSLAVANGYPDGMELSVGKCISWLDAQESVHIRDDCRGTSNLDAVLRAAVFADMIARYRTKEGIRKFTCTPAQAKAILASDIPNANAIERNPWFHVAPLD